MKQKTNNTVKQTSTQPTYAVSKRNKTIGIIWLIGPSISLIAILILYAIFSFIFKSVAGTGVKSLYGMASLMSIIFQGLGTICLLLILIGIPLGIIYLTKKEPAIDDKDIETSDKK